LAPQIRRVFAGKGEQLVEFDWSQAARKPRTWEARVILREQDEVVMVIRDISQRKQQEAELRLWAKVFEGSNEAILITDTILNIILVNKTYERITGYSEQEVLGVDTAKVGAQ